MSTTSWKVGNGAFTTAANWTAGVPGIGVDALIAGTSGVPLTVTFATSTITANTLSLTYATLAMSSGSLILQNASNLDGASTSTGFSQTGGTLEFQNGGLNTAVSLVGAVAQTKGTIKIDTGQLDVYGSSSFGGAVSGNGDLVLRGGYTYTLNAGVALTVGEIQLYDGSTVLSLNTDVTYGGVLYEYAYYDTIALGAHTLTLTGNSILNGTINGTGRVVISGITSADGMVLGGAAVFENKGTLTTASGFTLGDNSSSTAQLLIDAGATLNLTADTGIGRNGNATLVNAGTFEKTGNSGTSYIDALVTSTGTVAANSGFLYFRNNDSFGGTIGGTGQVVLGSGYQYTINAGTKLSVASLTLTDNGTVINLGGSLSYAGNLYLYNNSVLNLGANTFTLTAGNESIHGYITGSGRLISSASFDAENMVIGGSVTLENKATLSTANGFTVGDSGFSTATLLNDIGATIALTNGTGIGRNGNASIVNNGTLQFSGSGGTAYIDPILTSPGTVIANIGTLYFRNADSFSGQINGTGSVTLGGGFVYNLNAGTTLSVANFNITDGGTTAVLGSNLSYAGNLYLYNVSTLNLGTRSFTLSGTGNIHGYTSGSGKLLISAGTTTFDNAVIGGASVVEIGKGATIASTNGFTVGDGTSSTGKLQIDAGGTLNLVNGNGIGRLGTSTISNAGTFELTGGSGTAYIDPQFTQSAGGKVIANAGTLQFRNNDTFVGSLNGTGTIAFGSGFVYTLNKGTTIGVANLVVTDGGTTMVVASSLTDAGNLTLTGGNFITLNAGVTFTLTGSAALHGVVNGSGTLLLNNTTALFALDSMTLGGTATLEVKGLAGQGAGSLTLGDNSASAAVLKIDAGASYSITGNSYIYQNGNAGISNAGSFQKTGGTGISYVYPVISNTGTILVNTGGLNFQSVVTNDATISVVNGASIEFANALVADAGKTGTASIASGGTLRFDGFASTSETVSFADNTGHLVLANPGQFTATIAGFQGTVAQSASIDIVSLSGLTASYAGNTTSGTLTLTQSGVTKAQLHFLGSYTLASFKFAADGSGGTLITDPPAHHLGRLGGAAQTDLTGIGGLSQQPAAALSAAIGGGGGGSHQGPVDFAQALATLLATQHH